MEANTRRHNNTPKQIRIAMSGELQTSPGINRLLRR